MKDIKKLDENKICDRDCENNAVIRIKTTEGVPLHLCPKHRRKLENKIKNRIEERFEGLSQDEILEKLAEEGELI